MRRDLMKSSLAKGLAAAVAVSHPASAVPPAAGRAFWLTQMHRVAHPVLSALSQRRLRTTRTLQAG